MGCLKCGRDTKPDQVFCESCLEVMEWYPVKPGTAVQLPKRRNTPPRKVIKRRGPSLEEQVKSLRRAVWILAICLMVSISLVVLLAIPTYQHFTEELTRPGQNYSTVKPTPVQPRETTSGN